MKKQLSIVLALVLAMSLTACGGEKKQDSEKTTKQEQTTAAENGKAVAEGTLYDVSYDNSVWSLDEESVNDSEDGTYMKFLIPDGDDFTVRVNISASIAKAADFRDNLYTYGLDEKDYVDGKLDSVSIGGIDFVKYAKDTELHYLARVTPANATLTIDLSGEIDNENVDSFLEGIKFDLKDIGNEDAPWYWEGEPFSTDDLSAMVGSYTLKSHLLKMDEPDITHDVFDHRIAVVGDTTYILNNKKMSAYKSDTKTLTFDKDYDFDNEYKELQKADDNTLWISNFMQPLINWDNGNIKSSNKDSDIKYVAMHPSGTWGISYFTSGDDCAKLEIGSDGVAKATAIKFPEVGTISRIIVDNNNIYVTGSDAEDSDHKIFVYDFDGNRKLTMVGNEDDFGLGSVTFVAQTGNGYFALDGNMRKVVLFDKEGKYLGDIDDKDLFGTNYPWFCDAQANADGSITVLLTEKRADESATEVLVFNVTGF